MPRFTRSIAAAAAAGVTVAASKAAKTAKRVVKKSSAGAGASAAALASAAVAALAKASASAPTLPSALPGTRTRLKLLLKLKLKPKPEPASGFLAARDAISGGSAPIEPSAAESVPVVPVAAVKKPRTRKGAAKIEPATEPSTAVPAAPVAKAAPRSSRAVAGSHAAKGTLTNPMDVGTSATLDPPKHRPGRPAKSSIPATKASNTSSGPRSRPTRTAKPAASTTQDQPRQPDYSYLKRWEAEVARAAAADRGEYLGEVMGQNVAARTKGALTFADILTTRKAASTAKDAEPAQQRRLDPVTLGECEGVTTVEELEPGIRQAFFNFVHANPLPFTAGDLTRQAGILKPVILDLAEQLSRSDPRLFGLPAGSLLASNIRIQKFEDYDVVTAWDAVRKGWREWSKMVVELEGLAAVPYSAPSSASSSALTTSSSAEMGKKREREEDVEEEDKVSKKAKTAGEALAEPVVESRKRGASEAEVGAEEEKAIKRVRFRL